MGEHGRISVQSWHVCWKISRRAKRDQARIIVKVRKQKTRENQKENRKVSTERNIQTEAKALQKADQASNSRDQKQTQSLMNLNRRSPQKTRTETTRIFGVFGVPVLCAVVCSHTRTDTQQGHSTAQGHTAQSFKGFLLNVVVSLMIHKVFKNTGIKDLRKENGRKAYSVLWKVDACLAVNLSVCLSLVVSSLLFWCIFQLWKISYVSFF